MPDGSSQTRLATGVFNDSERPSGFFCRLLKPATSDPQGIRLRHQTLNPPICCPRQCVHFKPVGPIAQWLEQATHNRLVGGSNPSGPRFYRGSVELTEPEKGACSPVLGDSENPVILPT